jgi:hypothetical protein
MMMMTMELIMMNQIVRLYIDHIFFLDNDRNFTDLAIVTKIIPIDLKNLDFKCNILKLTCLVNIDKTLVLQSLLIFRF